MWQLKLLAALACIVVVSSVELTFELPDSAKQCFHQEIAANTKSTIEFQVGHKSADFLQLFFTLLNSPLYLCIEQVVTGGQYDVDLMVQDTRGKILYQGLKKQFETFTWTADTSGVYTLCFSNEFSTFSHKLVYFDLRVGDEPPLPGISDHMTAMTKVRISFMSCYLSQVLLALDQLMPYSFALLCQLEQSSANIHENLNSLIEAQTHYRLNENKGRKRAEDLNSKVLWWSLSEAAVVITITIAQVVILKNFFSDKKSTIRT
jgi:hypothetical protein